MTEVKFIQTYSGKALDILNPTVDQIDIENIAHALSLLCRFGGHCHEFYSVAEHSVRCSYKAPRGFELEALLHDGSEAYIVDMPRPIKELLPDYKKIELGIEKIIAEKFNLPFPMSPEVKLVDNTMLATEKRDLMKPSERPWSFLPDPYETKILPWTSKAAHKAFLDRYTELTTKKRIRTKTLETV